MRWQPVVEMWQQFNQIAWHPSRMHHHKAVLFLRCRFAQPQANVYDPFGIKDTTTPIDMPL